MCRPAPISLVRLFVPREPLSQFVCLFFVFTMISGCNGCSKKPEAKFIESEQAAALVPEIREAISTELSKMFGTVTSPNAPDWFPIERGGAVGTIEAIKDKNDAGKITSLKIKFEKTTPEIKAGDLFEVLLDPEAALEMEIEASENSKPSPTYPRMVAIASFDAASGVLTLAEPLCEMTEEGFSCVVNPNSKLVSGQRLYAQHCKKCHADTGDGSGPQSKILNPKPRDLRLGLLKFTSTKPGVKASYKDIRKLLKTGIAGTAMPSFNIIGNHDIGTLVHYTKYLAMRGEIERALCIESEIDFSQAVLDEQLAEAASEKEKQEIKEQFQNDVQEFLKVDFPEIVFDVSAEVSEKWSLADEPESILEPTTERTDPKGLSKAEPTISSIANGKLLYLSSSIQCASCHGDTGKGDGEQTTKKQKKPDGSEYDVVGLHDAWGSPVKPRDLTYGVFHGGREPVDVYRRIYVGVKGTPMPVYGGKGLSEAQIWDIVNFVYYLAGDYPDVTAESLNVNLPEPKPEK